MRWWALIASLSMVLPTFPSGAQEPLTPIEAQVVLYRAGWEQEAARDAYSVACGTMSHRDWGESACKPGVTGILGHQGLFQIDPDWKWLCGDVDLYQPTENARCARLIREYEEELGLPDYTHWDVKPGVAMEVRP